MRRYLAVIPAIVALCIPLPACGDPQLFSPPERGGGSAPPPAVSDSVITLVAEASYATLAKIAEQKLSASIPVAGGGQIGCIDVPYLVPGHTGSHDECRNIFGRRVCVTVPDFTGPSAGNNKQCADYHWHADITKVGPFQIQGAGSNLHIAQAVHVAGKAGVGGALAELLSLTGKNFEVDASPQVEVDASLDKNWCPVVMVTPIGSWFNSADVEIIGKSCVGVDLGPLGHPQVCIGPKNIGIANILNQELDKRRGDLQSAAQSAIPCDVIKPKLASQWKSYSIPISRPSLPVLYLNIQPTSAAFSGLIPSGDHLRIAVRVGAKTVLAAQPGPSEPLPLPPLERLDPRAGGLNVNLQAVAPYPLIKQQLLEVLKGRVFQNDIPGGHVEARVQDVDVYPSNGALAIGLKVDAKIPGTWLGVSGWLYLVGKPVPSKEGKAVTLEDIRFATVIDSAFWSAAQSLFQGVILQEIKAHSTFDLAKPIDDASNAITKAIAAAQIPGLAITTGAPALALESVSVTSDNLVAVVKLDLPLEAEVTEAIVK
jgi:Domain of unknown function (DUF4403)